MGPECHPLLLSCYIRMSFKGGGNPDDYYVLYERSKPVEKLRSCRRLNI